MYANVVGSLSRGLARLSAVQDSRAARARSVLSQCDPSMTSPAALSPVHFADTPPKVTRSASSSNLLTSGRFCRFVKHENVRVRRQRCPHTKVDEKQKCCRKKRKVKSVDEKVQATCSQFFSSLIDIYCCIQVPN